MNVDRWIYEEKEKKKKKNSKSNPVSLETRRFRDDFSGRADPRIPFTAHEGKERQLLIARGKDTRRNIQRYFSPATEIPGGDSRRNGNDLVVEIRPFRDQREDVNREFSPNTVNVLLHHPGEQKDLIKTLFPSPPPLEFPVYKRKNVQEGTGETIWKRSLSEVVKSKPDSLL